MVLYYCYLVYLGDLFVVVVGFNYTASLVKVCLGLKKIKEKKQQIHSEHVLHPDSKVKSDDVK